jgi:trans-aconitate 2-methyltransferase
MTSQSVTWNAAQYAKFLNERTRPAIELLTRVNLAKLQCAIDLGCGPGNSTELLKARWPDAQITGVDNSPEMLAAAMKDHPDIAFASSDIGTWQPEAPMDLIYSNAAYQWVPDHKVLIPRLASHLKPGGILAFQVPHNHDFPTHIFMRAVAVENKWSVDLGSVRTHHSVLEPQEYYDLLSPLMTDIDIWETKYFHVMESVEAVVEWLKGTGLRPFLAALPADEQKTFLKLYADKLRGFLPHLKDGKVLLPFPRLFVIARKT